MCANFQLPHSKLSTQDLELRTQDSVLRGVLRREEPMSKHTSWRVGGPAERFYIPADIADLSQFLQGLAADEPVHFIGLGSNLLVRDGGVRGTVVLLHGALNQLTLWHEKAGEATGVYAEAGVASPKVARFAALNGFEGAEFLAGIPGTVGGALAMNAGCYGAETWQTVTEVLTIDRFGELRRRTPQDFDIGYRHVCLKVRGEELGVGSKNKDEFTPHPSPLTRKSGSSPPGSPSSPATLRLRGKRSKACWKSGWRASRSARPMPARCSAIRPATMRRG